MKDLEKILYGNIVAYDNALLPEAGKNDLSDVLWRYCSNVGAQLYTCIVSIVSAMKFLLMHVVLMGFHALNL